jgi:hypothetical protein
MTRPRYEAIADVAMTSDADVAAHLDALLERALRHQVWVTFLDRADRPLPLLIPTDVPVEPDPEDVEGFRDFLTCLALEEPGCTIVLTFERPGPAEITSRDRRWLRLLRQALEWADFPYCGPFLLLGDTVRNVPSGEYRSEPWLEVDDD